MNQDDVSLDSIQDSDEDLLDPTTANYGEDAVFSGQDPDTISPDDEEE